MKESVPTLGGEGNTVRMVQIGAFAPRVLNRKALFTDQPLPNPPADKVKYGEPVAGFIGASVVVTLPLAIVPRPSAITVNAVVFVNTRDHLSLSQP